MADFESSTQTIPDVADIPRHVAVIMDGNGRWAKRRFLPRVAGHRKGIDSVRAVTRRCGELGVQYLTLFAFSSENWRRPKDEVSYLMQLFVAMLEQEVARLHSNGIRLKVVGSRDRFDTRLVGLIEQAEALTRGNDRLTLTVAANYGGRWDLMQAVNRMVAEAPPGTASFGEAELAGRLSMSYAPEPDLFIRTGGEQRVSNFLLWQLAYTELYFTDMLWPDFDAAALDQAVLWYQQRERRFGRTSEQLAAATKQKA
ncbi:MAG: polyprenyl diphosphate synthase [Pseudomonadota bacterium]